MQLECLLLNIVLVVDAAAVVSALWLSWDILSTLRKRAHLFPRSAVKSWRVVAYCSIGSAVCLGWAWMLLATLPNPCK